LANKKTNPFGEAPLRIPDISVSSILCFTLLSYKFISRSFLPYQSLWFPILAHYNPLCFYSAPDEMKETFSVTHRVTLLKCLQYQDNQDSPGYVLCKCDWVAKRTLILENFNPDQTTMLNWMKPLGYDLEELLDWYEYFNGKKTNIQKLAYSFFYSRLLSTFTDYDSGKSPAPQLERLSQQISAGVEASKKCVHTCELEVMSKFYDKKKLSLENNTMNLKKRKAYFMNDKVAMANQKLQEKESEMGLSSDD
jgi:hypothetical protein